MDSFNVTAGGDFYNEYATIDANDFNVIATGYFRNYATINANSFNVSAGLFFNHDSATINADNFNVTARYDFYHQYGSTINANNFNVTARDFYNSDNATISANDITIYANSFINTDTFGDGSITADTLSLSLAGDFDYSSDFQNNGNIKATTLNLQVGGDFSYDDASNDFVWNASDSLVVLGSAFITANSFINTGDITADTLNLSVAGDFDYISDYLNNGNIYANNQYFTIRNGDFSNNTSIALAGNLGITANNFINSGGSITADTFSLSVAGDFDYTDNYLNNGNIEATSLNFQVGGDFSYNDASNDFVWNIDDSLVVLGSAFITADDFSNYGAINVVNDFNVTAGDYFLNLG